MNGLSFIRAAALSGCVVMAACNDSTKLFTVDGGEEPETGGKTGSGGKGSGGTTASGGAVTTSGGSGTDRDAATSRDAGAGGAAPVVDGGADGDASSGS